MTHEVDHLLARVEKEIAEIRRMKDLCLRRWENGSPCSEPSWYSRKSLLRYLGFPEFPQKERQAAEQIIKHHNPKEHNKLKQPNELNKLEEPKEACYAKAEFFFGDQ